MHFDQYAKEFWENGYVYIQGFFESGVMDELNQKCLEHFGENPDWQHDVEFIEKSNCEIVPWFPAREGITDFKIIDDNVQFQALTEAILGEGWNDLYCMSMFSKAGSKGQAWHQDSPPEDPDKFNLNRLVYTHDITSDIGGEVVMMPKTHGKGAITVGDPDEDIEGQVVLAPKKGDLVFLHGHCWHRVLSVKGRYRISTNFRAMPKDTPEEITDTAVYRNMRYYFPTNEVIEERA